jgi:hypothetical protein
MSDQDTPAQIGLVEQRMRQALLRELMEPVPQESGEAPTTLELIARKLAKRALDGDMSAVKEVFDRIDGKSLAGVEPAIPAPQERVVRWAD